MRKKRMHLQFSETVALSNLNDTNSLQLPFHLDTFQRLTTPYVENITSMWHHLEKAHKPLSKDLNLQIAFYTSFHITLNCLPFHTILNYLPSSTVLLRCYVASAIQILILKEKVVLHFTRKKILDIYQPEYFVFQIPSLFGEDSFFGSKLQILSLVTQVLVFLGKGYLEDLVQQNIIQENQFVSITLLCYFEVLVLPHSLIQRKPKHIINQLK